MASIGLYLVIFFISAGLLSNRYKNNNICICIGLLISIIFAAGRYYVGTDFMSYIYMFDRCSGIPWNLFLASSYASSPLFFLICKIIYPIGGRVLTFGTMATLTVALTYRTLKKYYPDIALGTSMVIFFFSFYSFSFNVTRQYVAVAIIMNGLQYIYEDEFMKYLICIAIAVMFHKSAIIAVIMWFFWDHGRHCAVVGKKRIILMFMILMVVFCYRLVITFLANNISFFHSYAPFVNIAQRGTNNRDFYLALFQLIIVLIMSKKLKIKDTRVDFMITIMSVALLIGITGFSHPHIKRIAYYFQMPSALVLFGYFPVCVKEKEKVLASGLIAIYVVTKFVLVAYVLGQGNLIPYIFDVNTNVF